MPGLTRRRLYKRERRPARTKGILSRCAPIALPDANNNEVASALWALCSQAGISVGRAADYDGLRDEYTVIGKSMTTGKVQDFKVAGMVVAELVRFCRSMTGGGLIAGAAAKGLAVRRVPLAV